MVGSGTTTTVAAAVVVVTLGSVVVVVSFGVVVLVVELEDEELEDEELDDEELEDEELVVVVPGSPSAFVLIETSRLPELQLVEFEHSNPTIRMWYGEPLMLDAALPVPQSAWLATWPPHAMTAVEFFAVNTMLMRRSAVSAYEPESP